MYCPLQIARRIEIDAPKLMVILSKQIHMNIRLLFLLGFCGALTGLKAQDLPPPALTVSYFSEQLVHYGLKGGVEYPLRFQVKEKNKKGKVVRPKEKLLFATLNLGFYRHPKNHYALFLQPEIAMRTTKKSGFKTGYFLGAGYLRRFNDGPTFSVDDNGNVQQKTLGGENRLLTSFAFEIGKDWSKSKGVPLAWHVKPTLLFSIPHTHTIGLPQLAFDIGVSMPFDKFGKN